MKKQDNEMTLKGLVEIFLPKIWILVAVAVLFASAVGVHSLFVKKETYTSKGMYLVVKVPFSNSQGETNNTTTGINSAEIFGIQHMVSNLEAIIDTKDFCDKIIDSLNSDEVVEKFAGQGIDVADLVSKNNITTSSIRNMMKLSTAGSETTIFYLAVTSLDSKLSYVVAEVADEFLREELVDMGYAISVERKSAPRIATVANAKNTIRNTAVGFAVGLLVAMVVVFVIDRFDVVIRTREKLEDNFEVPILGVIPKFEPSN